MIITPNLIENAYNFIIKNDAVALHIKEIILGKNYFSRVRRFERSFYDGTVIDGARFFKKETFIKINGFDENLNGPEDWDLDKKFKQLGNILLLPSFDNIKDSENSISKRGLSEESQSGLTKGGLNKKLLNLQQLHLHIIEKKLSKIQRNFCRSLS